MSPAQRRYLLLEQGVGAGVVNFAINAAIAWVAFRGMTTVPLWGQQSIAGDTIGTTFLLPFITTLIASRLVRGHVRSGRIAGLAWDSSPLGRWMPRGLARRGAVFGLACVVLVGLPAPSALAAAGVAQMSFGRFVVFKALFAAVLAALVTPIIARAALADGHIPLASADPLILCQHRTRNAFVPAGLSTPACDSLAAMTTPENGNGPEPTGDCTLDPPPTHRRRRYSRSGFFALKSTLRRLGPRTIDRRTSLGKHLAAWRADLLADLGGEGALSTQQRALVDVIVRQKLLLESVDAWLLMQPSLVNGRKRALLPVVRERQGLADSLARYLAQLGLERRAKPVPSLDDYLRQRGPRNAEFLSPSPPRSAGPRDETDSRETSE